MADLNSITNKILMEFSALNKPISINADSNYLTINIGSSTTKILNWKMLSEHQILKISREFILNENTSSNRVLLNE